MGHGRGRCRATAAGGARHGLSSCVHSTRVVFNPSKVKIRVRVPMDAVAFCFFLPCPSRDFGVPYAMVVNTRLDGRAVQGAGFRHQSLRRRGFESHSNQSTFCFFPNTNLNFVLRFCQKFSLESSRLAQLVERKTLNLVVVGSSPTVGVLSFCVSIFLARRANLSL